MEDFAAEAKILLANRLFLENLAKSLLVKQM